MPGNHAGTGAADHVVRFDCFEADLDSGQLRKRGVKIKLRPQAFQILVRLIERSGQVVKREDLQQRLWSDEVFVDFEKSLNTAVAQLRQVLSDSADHPRFIETLPKIGYRFIANISEVPSAAEAKPTRSRLMVLPFVNMSGDPAQDYFSDAMTDEIITALASLAPQQLAVIARTTAMHYKGSHKDVAQIGRELNVDYVVEGGVLRWNSKVGVNVQLIQTIDQSHVFAKKYDAEMSDVFGLHDTIARAIAAHISSTSPRISGEAAPAEAIRRRPTSDLAAYNEYIKGRAEMWRPTPQSMAKAKEYFEAALARDPDFALACDGLAQLYWYLGFLGIAPSLEMDRIGRFYVLRAIEIDPELAETHALLSYYPKQRQYGDRLCYYDWPASLKDVERAKELNPTSPLVQLRYAIVLMILGRTVEAAAVLKRTLESDPLSLELRFWYAEILALARHYDEAIVEASRAVELEPDHFFAHIVYGLVRLESGRFDEATAPLRRALQLSGGLPLFLGWLGLALGLGGHASEARGVLERLHAIGSQGYVPPSCFAWCHLGLGEIDEAFAWMDRALESPDRMMSPIKSYSFFDPLRADPRFTALLRKMNLA